MKPLKKLRALFRKEKLDAEMTDEMRAHLELQAAEHVKRGLSPDEARYAAQRSFGGIEQIKERAREQRGFAWLEHLAQDLRFAMRKLRKSPGFSAAAIAVLALGIGLNSAMSSVVHALAFGARPYADPARVVQLYTQDEQNPSSFRAFSHAAYRELRERRDLFTGVLAQKLALVAVGEGAETRRAFSAIVSSNYFEVLGVPLLRGRGSWLPARRAMKVSPMFALRGE